MMGTKGVEENYCVAIPLLRLRIELDRINGMQDMECMQGRTPIHPSLGMQCKACKLQLDAEASKGGAAGARGAKKKHMAVQIEPNFGL